MAVLLLLAAATIALVTTDVAHVDAAIEQWNGKTVRIHGWLGTCRNFGCPLFARQEDEEKFRQAVTAGTRNYPSYLSIGGDRTFDDAAAPLNHRYVAITGRVSSACRPPHGICTDRAPDVDPVAIQAWRGPAR